MRRPGKSVPVLTPIQIEHFWQKVLVGGLDECWPWLGYIDTWGYGRVMISPDVFPAHKVAFTLSREPIPTGMLVCHSCDNRECCNPCHHFLGDDLINVRDGIRKNRFPKGSERAFSVLTEQQIRDIRSLYERGKYGSGIRKIAAIYGVVTRTIAKIVKRITWQHVS